VPAADARSQADAEGPADTVDSSPEEDTVDAVPAADARSQAGAVGPADPEHS